jgi:hypothetical protein
VESDRVRIFKEITEKIGMEKFNSQLQEYLERSLRGVATEALLERGGVESAHTGGGRSRVALETVRGELEEAKAVLIKAQEVTRQEVVAVKQELQKAQAATSGEVAESKKELKAELQKAQEAT